MVRLTHFGRHWWLPWGTLGLDISDNPHISHQFRFHFGTAERGHLKYAYKDASGWQIETVDSEGKAGWWLVYLPGTG